MSRIVTNLTYLACLLGLVSLGRAIAVLLGSGTEPGEPITQVGLLWLAWGTALLLPIMVAAWLAYLSRATLALALVPAALMAWMLLWTNGSGLMLWHSVRSSRSHGMSFSYELSLLGIFLLWPATLVCLVVWGLARRRLGRRAAAARAGDPTPQDTRAAAAPAFPSKRENRR